MSLTPRMRRAAEGFLAHHPPPGELLLCAVTGSHLYGLASPTSDLDLKGIHQAPTAELLRLRPVSRDLDEHDRTGLRDGWTCDLTTHELAPALRLLLRGNGNLLERVFSPMQLVQTPAVEELRRLAAASLSRASAGHYQGYFAALRREHHKAPGLKALLGCVRVALTGSHLLREGEVIADLRELAPLYGFPEALELAAARGRADEEAMLESVGASLAARLDELEALLHQSRAASSLPERPTNAEAMEAWLLDRRL